MVSKVEALLNQEVDSFPSRVTGEELYEYINRLSVPLVLNSRQDFVVAMAHWLQLRSEPKTMLAVELIGKNRLGELRVELEALLNDVKTGHVFKPYYERPINKSLQMI